MIQNLRETITEKIGEENHQVMNERSEGFDDDHDAVHAELERQCNMYTCYGNFIQKRTGCAESPMFSLIYIWFI